MFDELYKKLNTAQKKAVDAIEGPVMVIAGPGTGKTTILTLRIANILRRTDTPANGILAITYTDAGVKAMRSKLEHIIGNRAYDVHIHTFHGFAAMVLAEYPDHFLHLQDLKQMTDIEQESLLREILLDSKFVNLRPLARPDAYISAIMRTIDEAKREALSPRMVREYADVEAERIAKAEESISTRGASKGQLKADAKEAIEKCHRTALMSEVYELYEAKKHEQKRMDFNDLIIELLAGFRNDELLLRLIQERFLYIHVDEHQDTNDAQNFIVGMIAEFFELPNIFIVGDEKQAIYRFQGASVENFLLMQKRWPAMQIISLEKNYRSHQSILDASFAMIEKNYADGEHADLRIRLESGTDDLPRPIDVVTAENAHGADAYLVRELQAIIGREPAATIAIITRRNRDLERIIRLLESHSVPVASQRSVDIFNHPVGALFFNLIEYLSDPTRVDALAKTLIAGMWGITFDEAVLLIRDVRAGKTADIQKRISALAFIKKSQLSDSAVAFIIHAAERSGFMRLVSADPAYVYVWRGVVALTESLAREGDIHDPVELMKKLLAYRTSAESRTVKVTVGAPDVSTHALTAHGSKGLEYDYVFLPYATEESWVGKSRGRSFVLPKKFASDSDTADIRRLFYVALTRARKHVAVISPLEESDGKALSPLRFISELDPAHLQQVRIERSHVESTMSSSDVSGESQSYSEASTKLVDAAKRVLLEKGLSPTALNHFLTCPNLFLYQSILRLPQAPAVSAEKGNAMHLAIAAVWASDKQSLDSTEIENILREKIGEHFEHSLLALAEKNAVKKELFDAVPDVARELVSHTLIKKNAQSIFTEYRIQTNFVGSYEGKPLEITIHGKLDAIVDTGSEVKVFDYKTKQAMSVNEIKGLTKNSDGGYFRQLVFYKILVGGDSRWRMRSVVPALVFVSPDDAGRCPTVVLPIEEADIAKLRGDIQSLIDSVWSGKIAHAICEDRECEWCGLKKLLLS